MRKSISLLLTLSFMFFSATAWAGGDPAIEELLKEVRELKAVVQKQNERINDLEARLKERCTVDEKQQEKIDRYEKVVKREELQDISTRLKDQFERMKDLACLDIGVGATFIAQGTPNANNAGTKEDSRFDASWSMEISIGKAFDDWGYAYFLMEPGDGNGLDDDLSLFSLVNFDAASTGSNPTVTEVWYEHYLFGGQLTLTGGKIFGPNYIDTNEYANSEVTQFIGQMFRNAENIEFPSTDQAFGGRMNYAPEGLEAVELEALWMEADGDYEDVLDHPFIATQLTFKPAKAFDYDEEMWGGNYRAYFWYNGSDHTRLKDTGKTKDRNYGFGFSCDQKITDCFGWFGRFGWQDPSVSDLEYHWSTGLQMIGRRWNREDDVVAIAVGQAIPGKQYGDAGNPHDNETHLEMYYAFKVNEHLTISPDFQVIWNPNGISHSDQGDNDTIFVYGARGQVDF